MKIKVYVHLTDYTNNIGCITVNKYRNIYVND